LAPMLRRVPNWKGFLGQGLDEATLEDLRRHSRTGHPLGGKRFFTKLEKLFGQDVRPRKPGRPPQAEA
ncbi:MAG: transposase, partial [Alphaproteobacteria bacterium]|nr:transposase [Alphaproteobacteria bacterium]